MFHWGVTFLVITLIATVFGFGNLAGTIAGVAKIVSAVGIILFPMSLLVGRK